MKYNDLSYFTSQNLCSTFSVTQIAGSSFTQKKTFPSFKFLNNSLSLQSFVSLAMRSGLELLNLSIDHSSDLILQLFKEVTSNTSV